MSRKVHPQRITRVALGIRAQDLRTLVRKAWWARRWIAAIEALRLGPRLGRGRQYAVSGQVTDLGFAGPHVSASITGSRPQPYEVTLDFTPLGPAAAARITAWMKARPKLLARLATGDLPMELEGAFAGEGCPLFPVAGVKPPYDVRMTCSCPDWAKPCKHIAAVLFLLGEEVTRRPLTLLALRGLDVDSLFPPDTARKKARTLELSAPLDMFTGVGDGGAVAFLKRLGPVPLWRGVSRCTETLEHMAMRQRPVAEAAAEGRSIDLSMK